MKEFLKKYLYNYYFLCVTAAFLINFLIECFSRHSIVAAFQYLMGSPIVFIYNVVLILVTLSIVFLVRRKVFVFTTISIIWLAGGITNGIVLNNRVTPFTANELKLISSTFDILEKYFTKFEMGLIIVGILIAIVGVIISFFKAPKSRNKVNYKKSVPLFGAIVLSFILLTQGALKANIISDYFGNVAFAYLDYGFPYCFTNTLLNTGIKRPINYTEATMNDLAQTLVQNNESSELDNSNLVASNDNTLVPQKQAPNIIMLQLESFFDPTYMKDLEFQPIQFLTLES